MSKEFEIENVNNFNYDHRKNIIINNFNSASMQTSKGPDLYHDENLFNNIMTKNESNDLNNIYKMDDKIKAKNEKFAEDQKIKYTKFLNFIKERHFKKFSTNKKNFRTFTPHNYTFPTQLHKSTKDPPSIFLTQDFNKKKKKEEDKLLILYKRIFDKGLDEANYFSSIKLIPLVENNVHDWKNSIDYEDNNEIEILTGSNFHSKYTHPTDEHTFRLMKKKGFLNFQTNPSLKKGLNYNKSAYKSNTNIVIDVKEKNPLIFYQTAGFTTSASQEKKNKTGVLKEEKSTLLEKIRKESNKALINDNLSTKKDKIERKIRKPKIVDSNLMTVNENQIINAKMSKFNSNNTSVNRDDLIMIDDLFDKSKVNKSKSNFKKFNKDELTCIIKSKQKRFNSLKKKVFSKNKNFEDFEKIKNCKFVPSKTFNKIESVNTPFSSAERSRKNYFNMPNKERIVGIYEDKIKERQMTKVLYNIFDKYEVDYVLKQNKFKLNV